MSLPTLLSDKITGHHHDRLAIVYIRQSTLQQVGRHPESTRLQYGLVERAVQLGWARERITVIDEDLGRSGATAERPGFQRLVAEVGLGRVGLVLGIEMSRLARSCRDWYQLLEICAVSGTLIADNDGVCDPAVYNDRLLLGLKGTMSEAELHLLKTRLDQGKRAKARRGELFFTLPCGYLRRASGEITLDPDEQVQATIRLVFDVFERRRSVNGVLAYCVAHDVRLPFRIRSGAAKGELEWHPANRYRLGRILRNPAYGGAYAYGRRSGSRGDSRGGGGQAGAAWEVLLKDHWPAYIPWDTYERNCAQVAANRSQSLGIPRGGQALLSGLLECGRCGRRMLTQYPAHGRFLRYECARAHATYGQARCQSLSGRALDALVGGLILETLAPAAVEASVQLAEDLELERTALHRQWRQRVERAHYDVDRARRQYNQVEPENRLVARALERQWEEALANEVRAQADYTRFLEDQPLPLTPKECAQIRRLAEDVPALWQAATTTAADRQAIARLLLDRVVVTVAGTSEHVQVTCHWAGGTCTEHEFQRPVRRLEQLSYFDTLKKRLTDLYQRGLTAAEIAAALNAEGWRPPKRRDSYNSMMVNDLLHWIGVPVHPRPSPSHRVARQDPAELTFRELAHRLDMPTQTLYCWLRRGLLTGRMASVGGQSLWLIQADEAEVTRLRQLRLASSTHERKEQSRRLVEKA
jgi:DNA invertase Pin-like site-specific DNA recombinase/methylphosphotriester-DNA--protein-cysteine methyltransferase